MDHTTSPPTSPPPRAPHLSNAQLAACRARADAQLEATLRSYAQLDGLLDRARWRCVGGRTGVSAFRGRVDADPAAVALLCVGTLRARLDAVLGGLQSASSDAMRAQSAVSCPRVSRCAVLQAAASRPASAFLGVKWLALRALGGCVSDREVAYFEASGLVRSEARGPRGRRLAYVAMQSLPPGVAGRASDSAGRLALCYLLEELEAAPPRVGVYMLGSVAGFGPPYLMVSVFVDLALSVTRAADVARARALGALVAAADDPAARGGSLSFSGAGGRGARCDECGGAALVFGTLSACAGCRRSRVCRRCRRRERVLVWDAAQGRTRARWAGFCPGCRKRADAEVDGGAVDAGGDMVDGDDVASAGDVAGGGDVRALRLASDASDGFPERSLAVFSLKIARHLRALDQQSSEQRSSALSSLGTDELGRLLSSGGLPGEDEDGGDQDGDPSDDGDAGGRHGGADPFAIEDLKERVDGEYARPRLSRFSTASSSSRSPGGDAAAALAAHRQSLLTRLQTATDQAERTFHLARAQSAAARAALTRLQWLDLE